MDAVKERSGEYWIDVNAITGPDHEGYVAKVVVVKLPEMREIFRGEFPAGEFPAGSPPRARCKAMLAAALASGQHAVRMEQCRLSRS